MQTGWLWGVVWCLFGGLAEAQALSARIQAVQPPAWLERAQQRQPLALGTALESADLIHTGDGGRVELALAEGSRIRLGEHAHFKLAYLPKSPQSAQPFKANLAVLKGAFRFTTGVVGKSQPRDVQIQVATVTAGIRGTDVWGKSDAENDMVCLLEGKIQVQHLTDTPLAMDQPLSFFVAPKGQAALPIAAVDPHKVNTVWLPQTALPDDALSEAGAYHLTVLAGLTEQDAQRWSRRLQEGGYPVVIVPSQGLGLRDIQLVGFRHEAHTVTTLKRLQTIFSIPTQ